MIDTPSLALRCLLPEDAPVMMALNAEPSTRFWIPSHVYETREEADARIAYLISKFASPGDPSRGAYVFGVALRDGGRLIGHVGFSPLDDEVEVSYAIAEAERGRGYGVQALSGACHWVSATFSLPRIIAVTASANTISRSTLLRASFAHQRDEVMSFQGVETPVSRYAWSAQAP